MEKQQHREKNNEYLNWVTNEHVDEHGFSIWIHAHTHKYWSLNKRHAEMHIMEQKIERNGNMFVPIFFAFERSSRMGFRKLRSQFTRFFHLHSSILIEDTIFLLFLLVWLEKKRHQRMLHHVAIPLHSTSYTNKWELAWCVLQHPIEERTKFFFNLTCYAFISLNHWLNAQRAVSRWLLWLLLLKCCAVTTNWIWYTLQILLFFNVHWIQH